jgi:hypothetical protein
VQGTIHTMSNEPITPLTELIKTIMNRSLNTGIDLSQQEWFNFWAHVAENVADLHPEDTPSLIDDVLDRAWSRFTDNQRLYNELRHLHHLLLVTAGAREVPEFETLLLFFDDHIKLPRILDRVANLALLSSLTQLRDAIDQSDPGAAREAMAAYFNLLTPHQLPVCAIYS